MKWEPETEGDEPKTMTNATSLIMLRQGWYYALMFACLCLMEGMAPVLGSCRPAFVVYQRSQCRHDAAFEHTNDDAIESMSTVGLYRPFVEHAWSKLQESGLFIPTSIPLELQKNSAPAKGMPPGSVVRMETKAMIPASSPSNVHYARYALLETLVPSEQINSTGGIQVMNLVVFPSKESALPVWGVDLVSLPGGRHLLAMDVQPMSTEYELDQCWRDWHKDVVQDAFPWGGDVPEDATNYFSECALWTRLKGGENATTVIQTQVWDAFCQHLDLYLQLLESHQPSSLNSNTQEEYVRYRLDRDPARPMLQSLYGPDWTERVLEEVLFPLKKWE